MTGTVLDIWSDNGFEVEFLDSEGFNYEYQGQATFTVKAADIVVVYSTKSKNKSLVQNTGGVPVWLRYVCILAGLLYLLYILFFSSGRQRVDFPVF